MSADARWAPHWWLTTECFLAVWDPAMRDDLPFPLRYTSPQHWLDDQHRALADARARVDAEPDPARDAAVALVRRPDVVVEMYAIDRSDAEVRLRAGIARDTAAFAVEQPGGFAVRTMPTHLLADALLPYAGATSPGHEPACAADAPPRTGERRDSVLDHVASTRPADDRVRRLLERPRCASGSVRVATTGRRDAHDATLGWFDAEGDGRYLYRTGDRVEVRPATPTVFRNDLTRMIVTAQTRLHGPDGASVLRSSHLSVP